MYFGTKWLIEGHYPYAPNYHCIDMDEKEISFFLYFEWKLSVSGSSCPPQASEATNRGSPPPGAAPVISAFSPPCAAAHILPPKGSSRKPRLRRDSSQKFGAMGAVFWRLWMCNYRAGRYFLKPKLCETFLAPQP